MTEHKNRPQDVVASSQNRYVLMAVLAVAAVIAVFLLKTNMIPPETGAGGGAPTGGESVEQMSMEDMIAQLDHVKEMMLQDSSSFEAWASVGNLYFDANMPEEAVTHYLRALEIKPNDLGVMTDLSTMRRALGDHDEAISLLKEVVILDSLWQQAWFNMGVIYSMDLGDNRSAVDAWTRFVALNPQSEHAESVRKEIARLKKDLEG